MDGRLSFGVGKTSPLGQQFRDGEVRVSAYGGPVAEVHLERVGDALSGSLGDTRVDLELDVPHSRAGIRGTCGGVSVNGYWRIESNHDNLEPVGLFLGDYGGLPVHLRNEVHLTPHYSLRSADLTGTVGEQSVRARIASVEAPAHGPTVLGVDGDFEGQTISVYVASDANLTGLHLDGLIGGRPVKLDVTRRSVRGEYAGPHVLFCLFACVPLYFL